MEISTTATIILIGILAIAILLRLFGRELSNYLKGLSRKEKRWILLIGGITASASLVFLFFSLFMQQKAQKEFEKPKVPSRYDFLTTPEELVISNPGVFKSIKQRLCKAEDSIGVANCVAHNISIYRNWSEDIWIDKLGRITKGNRYYNYSGFNGIESRTIHSYQSQFLNNGDEQTSYRGIGTRYSGDSIVSIDSVWRDYFYENNLLVELKKSSTRTQDNQSIIKYKYDDQNRQIEEATYVADSLDNYSLKTRNLFFFIADSVKEIRTYTDGELVRIERLVFDREGRCYKVIAKEGDEKIVEQFFEYDSEGRIIECSQNSFIDFRTENEFSYDSKDRIVEFFTLNTRSDSTTSMTKTLFEFNINGNIISRVDSVFYNEIFAREEVERYIYEFSPEQDDFWARLTIYVNGELTYLFEREYEFY